MKPSGIMRAPLRRLEVVESTNSLLKAEAELGRAIEGTVITAEHQTAGRGRLDRRWEAPPGKGLLFSVLLYPDLEADKMPLVGLMVGLAVNESIRQFVNSSITEAVSHQPSAIRNQKSVINLKWPNDILAGGRKLCGILCESGVDPKGRRFVVAGVGFNVNQTAADFPRELRETATSLYLVTGITQPRDLLLGSVLNGIESHYTRLRNEGAAWIVPEWLAQSDGVGREITVSDGKSKITGIMDGLESNGALRLRMNDGSIKIIHSGDVN